MSTLHASASGVLGPAGPVAANIERLWWIMFWLGTVAFVVVVVLLIGGLFRRQRGGRLTDRHFVVYGGLVLSVLLLVPVVAATATTQMNLSVAGDQRLEVHVTGHQFWWDIEYVDDDGTVRTANELHLPVGVPVDLHLGSSDVIHSLWIPELAGKLDLVPGRINQLEVTVDDPGEFTARCAEFCGLGHARMQMVVVAHTPDEFDDWLADQRLPADIDVDTATLQEFANSCAPCHTVRGVFDDPMYEGHFGPDLTHIGSRRMLAAGAVAHTREAMGLWIVDPQRVKTGTRMPAVGVDADELTDILDLLEQLK